MTKTTFGGLITVLQELKVNNVIIGKQFEKTENYEKFLQIVKENKINVKVVVAGNRINIEDNIFIDILWPKMDEKVSENSINNNALVCKLNFDDFKALFTGDIEQEAEKILVSKYQYNNILKSNILKVAHHGSKTSSTKEFLQLVKPEISLIGVGENNTFGHPSNNTLENLKSIGSDIFRTDCNGEISIYTDGKKYSVKEKINTK